MLADVTIPATSEGTMHLNAFDLVVVVVLGFGIFRGRRNGMSKDLLPLLKWLFLLPVCAIGYQKVGGFLKDLAHLGDFWSLVYAYCALALGVFVVFTGLERVYSERLAKSNVFRGGEYYLGMLSGVIRYAFMIIFVMALLNARAYTQAEIDKANADDKQSLGGGVFSGNYFPHLFNIQDWVFKESFAGSCVKKNLPMLLITTTAVEELQNGAPLPPPKKPPVIQIGNPSTNPPAPAK
jgi:hypothetical protein